MIIVTGMVENQNIDTVNKIEREINGCKVRIRFCKNANELNQRLVLDNLLLIFDDKIQGMSTVQK